MHHWHRYVLHLYIRRYRPVFARRIFCADNAGFNLSFAVRNARRPEAFVVYYCGALVSNFAAEKRTSKIKR